MENNIGLYFFFWIAAFVQMNISFFFLSFFLCFSLSLLSFGSGKISAYLDNNPSNFFFFLTESSIQMRN